MKKFDKKIDLIVAPSILTHIALIHTIDRYDCQTV